jgi:cyclin-dependent kinase 7
LREIKFLQETKHINIIKLYDVFYVQKSIFLVLEYTPFDMGAIIREGSKSGVVLKDEHIKNLFHQVLQALEYLHNTHYLMHRVR